MELEKAINRTKDLMQDIEHRKMDCEAIETVLKELNREDRIINSLKIALEERTNERDRKDNQILKLRAVTTKQEKMIELMAEHISFGEDIQKILCSPKVHKEGACTCITCKRCIKQYFEKKVEG